MFKNKKKSIIGDRVMAVIESRIAEKDIEFQKGCEEIDLDADMAKDNLSIKLVNEVLTGK
jgi:hypothetical protein